MVDTDVSKEVTAADKTVHIRLWIFLQNAVKRCVQQVALGGGKCLRRTRKGLQDTGRVRDSGSEEKTRGRAADVTRMDRVRNESSRVQTGMVQRRESGCRSKEA